MSSGFTLDPSRIVGITAFAIAALACMYASAGAAPRRLLWRILGAAELACAAEVLIGLRYRVHGAVDSLLQARGWYESRGQWQPGMLAGALALTAALVAFACWRHRADAAATTAIIATAAGLSLFGVEAISLHGIDAIMYASAGPIVALAWWWIGVAALATGAALAGRRRGA